MLNTKAPRGSMLTTFPNLVADAYEVKRRQYAAHLQRKADRAARRAQRLLALLLLLSLLFNAAFALNAADTPKNREYNTPRYSVLNWGPCLD